MGGWSDAMQSVMRNMVWKLICKTNAILVFPDPGPIHEAIEDVWGKDSPGDNPRPQPKRQRAGAVQDLAEFPNALRCAERLGLRLSSLILTGKNAD